ncbi:DUF2167 domain-containing protein [Paenibacillus sp. NPDC056933]|uniref:DUF2167 domain-containing protein n=1 Tax=Paenibacillus sp. NPDC056933 TaxID=3345968 RepID=UPI00362A600F
MKNKNKRCFLALLLVSLLTFSFAVQVFASSETDKAPDEYDWIDGPASVSLDNKATLEIQENNYFLDKANTQRSMLNMGSKPNGNEIGSLYSDSQSGSLYVVFEYVKTGHIDDREQNLDANELLSSYIRGTEEENRNAAPEDKMYVTGWEIEPTYDSSNHRLIYSLGFKDAYQQSMVNYNVKLLTREGYITAILVTETANFQQSRLAFEEMVLNRLSINTGYTYEDYDASTDKTSTVGLKSLLVGGIGYTAGQKFSILILLKKGWPFIVIVLLALLGWNKYKMKTSKKDEAMLSPTEKAYLQDADEQQYAEQNELSFYRKSGQQSETKRT